MPADCTELDMTLFFLSNFNAEFSKILIREKYIVENFAWSLDKKKLFFFIQTIQSAERESKMKLQADLTWKNKCFVSMNIKKVTNTPCINRSC